MVLGESGAVSGRPHRRALIFPLSLARCLGCPRAGLCVSEAKGAPTRGKLKERSEVPRGGRWERRLGRPAAGRRREPRMRAED